MFTKQSSIYLKCYLIILIHSTIVLVSCDAQKVKNNIEDTANTTKQQDSFLLKLKKFNSTPNVKVQTATIKEFLRFTMQILPDTTNCNAFVAQRQFIGDMINAIVIVQEYGPQRRFLMAGNLKLYPCNLPSDIKKADTLIISAKVFYTEPNEKGWGLPTVIYKINRLQ